MARNTRSGRQKSFKHYLEFPPEVRMMVIDEMEPDDRCRFRRCSNLCLKEAQRSRNYIYGLTFDNSSEESLKIHVIHDHKGYYNYQVEFQTKNDKKCMKYSIPSGNSSKELWSIDLDSSIDMVYLASDYFKKLLEFYQNTIQLLRITGKWNYDVEVKNMGKLKSLGLSNCVGNIVSTISRRQRPLELFSYDGEMDEKFLEANEYIFQVQKRLSIHSLKLNVAQFKRLSANIVRIHIGTLTPTDIFNFIKAWQNGKLRDNFELAIWELNDSDFEIEELWQLLRLEPTDPDSSWFKIHHNLVPGRYARLRYIWNAKERLAFRVVDHSR